MMGNHSRKFNALFGCPAISSLDVSPDPLLRGSILWGQAHHQRQRFQVAAHEGSCKFEAVAAKIAEYCTIEKPPVVLGEHRSSLPLVGDADSMRASWSGF